MEATGAAKEFKNLYNVDWRPVDISLIKKLEDIL